MAVVVARAVRLPSAVQVASAVRAEQAAPVAWQALVEMPGLRASVVWVASVVRAA